MPLMPSSSLRTSAPVTSAKSVPFGYHLRTLTYYDLAIEDVKEIVYNALGVVNE